MTDYYANLLATEAAYAEIVAAQAAIVKAYKWTRTNPGASRDEGSYYVSKDGRFEISPNFRHTTTPDSYTLHDNVLGTNDNCAGIRELKRLAALRVAEGK